MYDIFRLWIGGVGRSVCWLVFGFAGWIGLGRSICRNVGGLEYGHVGTLIAGCLFLFWLLGELVVESLSGLSGG